MGPLLSRASRPGEFDSEGKTCGKKVRREGRRNERNRIEKRDHKKVDGNR